MKLKGMLLAVVAAVTSVAGAKTIVCAEAGPCHLQGVACDGEAIYWSFTTRIVKTDLTGSHVLAGVDVPMHSGDLCVHRGEVYVATDEGMFVRSSGLKQEVRVYDAATLAFNRKYTLNKDMDSRGFHSSCIEYSDGRFWMPAGFDEGSTTEKNYVLEYTPSFDLVAVHELPTGNTQYGIQTIARNGDQFVLGTYSGATVAGGAFVTDLGCKGFVHSSVRASEGVMSIGGVLYTAVSAKNDAGKWVATATSVERTVGYEVDGASGSTVATPSALLGYGFLPTSWYYGGVDQTISDALAGERNLVANGCDLGGAVLTVAEGAHAIAGGVAVPSGTLTLPSADMLGKGAAPIVLSEGTLRFADGGTMGRDIVIAPFAGCEKRSAIIDVAADAVVTNTGRVLTPGHVGNLVKSGAGTLVIATEPGPEACVTNRFGSDGAHGSMYRAVMNVQPNGDGPTAGNPAFGVIDGRFVIDTPVGVVNEFGNETIVGGTTTTAADAETAGHMDVLHGIVNFTGWLGIGRQNGTAVTAPQGLVSTFSLHDGEVTCLDLSLGYAEVPNTIYTMRPELNVYGGVLRVRNDVRLDHTYSWGRFNVDGGTFIAQKFRNSNYYPGSHVEINVSNGGEFRTTEHLALAHHSTAEHPSYARVNVTDGGVLSLKTMYKSSEYAAADVELHFNGGVLRSYQSAYEDQILPGEKIFVGEKGMTVDVSNATYWGLKINSPIAATAGTGGIAVVNGTDSANRWVCFNGGVEVPGGLTVENACVLFDKDVKADVTVRDDVSAVRATGDITVDSLTFEGREALLECAMSGAADAAGVRAYLLTAKSFVPPEGLIKVVMMKTDSTSYSVPYGTFPFLRIPASAAVDVTRFACRHGNNDSNYYRFTETVADGWRTISIVHETTDGRPQVDPRTADWISGSGKTWTLGPWLLPYNGAEAACSNYMRGDKAKDQVGGLSVSSALTLVGGGEVAKGPFVKLGDGRLTLGGDTLYSFGTEYVGQTPTADSSTWDIFDGSGNSRYAFSAGIIVGAGTLAIGRGYDSPTVRFPSGNGLWIGTTTTSAAGGEKDAKLEFDSGCLQMNGEFTVGYSHGTPTTAANTPLKADYVQEGGSVSVGTLTVGYGGYAPFGPQTDTFTLNGGYFEAKFAKIGHVSTENSNAYRPKMVINGGRLEIGKAYYDTTTEGRLLVSYTQPGDQIVTYEQNGGEVVCWKGFQCWNAKDANHKTQVWLNGGTLTFGKGIFFGGDYSDLHLNGGTLKPYVPVHQEQISGIFQWYTTRTIEDGGCIFDLSEADIDFLPISYALGGTGDFTVRGGDTNRCVRFATAPTTTGDIIAEKGGVVQSWSSCLANHRVFVKDGGGVASYYGNAIKEIHLGEKESDVTVAYGYGFAGVNPLVASAALTVKGTVYLAQRIAGSRNELRMSPGKYAMLRGPKGCFEGLDIEKTFKLHPALVAQGAVCTFFLDTANDGYDQISADCASGVSVSPASLNVPAYPGVLSIDSPRRIDGTVSLTAQGYDNRYPPTSGSGTVRVNAPLEGDGTIKLTSGRIEGRPEFFNGLTLDLNNASVRFTESGRTTANIVNSNGGTTGLGLEVAEGKTVIVEGAFDNKSALVKMDPGTLVLQGAGDYTLLATTDKSRDSAWTTANVPKNGDVPYAAPLTVNAGTLVLDTPGLVTVTNEANNAYCWIASHFIPDGEGGAYPAILELRQGTFVATYDMFLVGRHVGGDWDNHAQFTKRPYAAFNVRGGTAILNGLTLGYNNYKYNNCALYEVNLFGGRIQVGGGRMAIPHDSTNLKIGDDLNEGVVNVYGGELVKTSGEIALGEWYGDNAGKTYPAIGKLNVYGGAVRTAATGEIDVPYNKGGVGYVSLYGGLVETKNFVRRNSVAGTEGHIRFDGGTFRPLQNNGTLSGFTDVTVGLGGGVIDVPDANTYIVAQKLERAADIGSAKDGGFRSAGAGTLALNVANDFNGPVGAAGTSTLKQGVAGAFSDKAKMGGGTLDLNGIATAFSEVRGHGTIVGNATVSGVLELDGALTFDGNLTLGSGTVVRMNVNDDGSAADYLKVTGSLVCNGPVVFDFMREYDDVAVFGEFSSVIGEAGTISGFSARATNITRGRRYIVDVSANNGRVVLRSTKRGSLVIVR